MIDHLRRYWHGITPSESVKVKHSPLASKNLTISRKRCKIVGKLVLIANRKSYISFRLVLKSVTLNDLERRNGRYIALLQRILWTCVPTHNHFLEHWTYWSRVNFYNTYRAVKLVCVTKFTHSREDTIPENRLTLLSFNLSSKFHFTVAMIWRLASGWYFCVRTVTTCTPCCTAGGGMGGAVLCNTCTMS